jgi:succinate dehydrogenase / fumarate reductase membrane anchor subunit
MPAPLNRVRGLGSARSGTGHFWLQRATAMANLPLTVILVFLLVTLVGRSHAVVASTLGDPAVAVLLLAAILSVVLHMRVGMQVIIEDYVHHEGTKLTLLVANLFFTVGLGLTAAFAVLRISFGL